MLADFRLAFRLLRQAPGYAAIVVATLALGIGGVTAVFTLADPMLFRPLPYADSDRIVDVRARVKNTATLRLHADDFVAIATKSQTLEAASTLGNPIVATFRGARQPILGGGISSEFLRLTGLHPVQGRLFAPEEYEHDPSQPPAVAMLTWNFWQTAFGGASDVVGTRLDVGGFRPLSMEIVGILPREFFYPEPINEAPVFIVPGNMDRRLLGRKNTYPVTFARLKPGVTTEQAEAEIDQLLAGVERANPGFEQGRRAHLIPLQQQIFGSLRTPLLLLFIATACVLLLAWVNLAHLAQARAQTRARELAVRVALGAGRWRVVRLLVTEASVLGLLGAGAGLVVGSALFTWGMSKTPRFGHIYRLLPAALDTRVVLLALALSAIGMIALALWPAIRAVRLDLRSVIASGSSRRSGWRAGGEALTIVAQAGFAVALVATCAVVVRSFVALSTADRGFDPAGVRVAGVTMPPALPPPMLADRFRQVIAALNGVRGVSAAAVSNGIPALTLPDGLVNAAGARIPDVIAYQVSDRMSAVMGMHLEEGRLFDEAEAFAAAPVAVVDRYAADAIWPGERALGKTVRLSNGRAFTVVGVLQRVKAGLLPDADPRGTAFLTIDPSSDAVVNRLSVSLRFDSTRTPNDQELSAAVASVSGATWGGANTMASWERVLGQPRFLASALGVLGVLTALLAAFGVLGVVSHLVSRRTREIGIRLAIGASQSAVRRLVVRQALLPATAGVVAGLLLAFWWSASVRAAVIGISPRDPWSFAGAALLTLAVVVIATLKPALSASRIDPAITLRSE